MDLHVFPILNPPPTSVPNIFKSALYLLQFWKYVLGWFWKRNIYFSYKISKKGRGKKSPLKWTVQLQLLSRVWLFPTPWTTARQASLSITNSRSLLKLLSIESVMPSSHLILCPPLLLLPSVFPSVRVFSNESKKLSWVAVYSLRRICCFIRFSYSICWKNRWNSLPPCFGRGSDLFLLLFTSGGQGIGISASASILKWARWLLLMPVSPGKERFLEVYG